MRELTDSEHWDNYYDSQNKVRKDTTICLTNYVYKQFDQYFKGLFKEVSLLENRSLIELGCGNSKWLPYFNKNCGFDVYGIDYSAKGVELAKKNLEINGVIGEIFLSDLLKPQHNQKQFDVVVSFGVIEHFDDTSTILDKMSVYVKKGGILISAVPNLLGINGKLSYILQRKLYFKHKAIPREDLIRLFRQCGYSDIKCEYIGIFNLGVINWTNLTSVPAPLRKLVRMVGRIVQVLARKLIVITSITNESKLLSPYIICAGKKKC